MDRIRRIAGVRSVPTRRIGGWIAPVAIAMSVTAAVSAMAITATSRDVTSDDAEFNPLDQVDVVGILREYDSAQTDLVGFLAEHGMSNQVLMAVLEELGADQRVFTEVDRATEREAYIESQMPKAREWVASELAAGRITMDQARAHLDMARRELQQLMRAERQAEARDHEEAERQAILDVLLTEVHQQVTGEVVEGRLSEQDAKRALEIAREDAHMEEWLARQGALEAEKRESVKARMRAFHEQLRSDLADGRITEEQAHERMQRAKQELNTVLEGQRTVHLRQIEADRRMADMRQQGALIREQIDLAAAQGRTEEAEVAMQQLQRYEQEMANLQREIAVELRHSQQAERRAREFHQRDLTKQTVERPLVEFHEHAVGVPLPPARHPERHELEDVKRQLTAGVAAGHLTEADAKEKLAAVHRDLARSYKERATRYRLSDRDRKALAAGLDRARAQLDKQVAAGKLTEEQLAKRLARLAKLEQSLAEEAKRRADRAARSAERRILEEKAQQDLTLPKKKPADR